MGGFCFISWILEAVVEGEGRGATGESTYGCWAGCRG